MRPFIMNVMNDEKILTLEAKAAVRGYMLKLIAIPGIVIAVGGFFLGYMIQDVASQKAYYDAFKSTQTVIDQLKNNVYIAVASAKLSQQQAEELVSKSKIVFESVNNLKENLEALKGFQQSDKMVEQIKDAIISQDSFRRDVVKASLANISKIEKDLAKLEKVAIKDIIYNYNSLADGYFRIGYSSISPSGWSCVLANDPNIIGAKDDYICYTTKYPKESHYP